MLPPLLTGVVAASGAIYGRPRLLWLCCCCEKRGREICSQQWRLPGAQPASGQLSPPHSSHHQPPGQGSTFISLLQGGLTQPGFSLMPSNISVTEYIYSYLIPGGFPRQAHSQLNSFCVAAQNGSVRHSWPLMRFRNNLHFLRLADRCWAAALC